MKNKIPNQAINGTDTARLLELFRQLKTKQPMVRGLLPNNALDVPLGILHQELMAEGAAVSPMADKRVKRTKVKDIQ